MQNIKLSPSKIVLFDKCPRKFYYKYIENIKEPSTAATVRGTIFHKVLEDFYQVIDIKNYLEVHWEDMAKNFEKIVEQLFEAEWSRIGVDYEDVFEDGEMEDMYKETKEFLRFFAFKEAFRLREIFNQNNSKDFWFETNVKRSFFPKDKELYIDLGKMHGYIDKTINVYGKGTGIVDYKTSKSSIPHFIDKSHLLQLKAYAYLYKKQTGELPHHLSIYYARTGESVYYETNDEDVEEIKRIILQMRNLSRDISDFPQKTSKLCNWCFYKDICKPDMSNV